MRSLLSLCALVLAAMVAWLFWERPATAAPGETSAEGAPAQAASRRAAGPSADPSPASTAATALGRQPAAVLRPRGRIVEWHTNRPVPVTLIATEVAARAPRAETLVLSATSDVDGRFVFDEPLYPGWWRLSTLEGRRVVRPHVFALEAGRDLVPLHVIVDDGGSSDGIDGRVIDSLNGKGVAGVVVCGRGQGDFHVTSREDGTFALDTSGPGQGAVELTIQLHWAGRGLESFPYQMVAPLVVERGTPNVELVLVRAAKFTLYVEDERGRPIEAFAAAVVSPNAGGDLPLQQRTHPGGTVTFAGIADQHEYVAVVVPADPELSPSAPIAVRRAAGQPDRLRVRLQHRREVSVCCVDARGEGLAGARLSVLHPVPFAWRNPQLPGARVEDLAHISEQDLCYGSATTDAAGRASMRLPSSLTGYIVRVEGSEAQFYEHAGAALDLDAQPVRIVVPDGGDVRVRVANLLDPTDCEVRLRRGAAADPGKPFSWEPDGVSLPLPGQTPWMLDASGSVAIRRVPAGQWSVWLAHDNIDWPVGSVRVRDGDAHELVCQARAFGFENVRLRVQVDGQPGKDITIVDEALSPGLQACGLDERTDERGVVEAGAPAGRMRLVALWQDATGSAQLPLGVVEVVRAGQNDFSFALHRERRRVRFVDERGRGLPWMPLQVVDGSEELVWATRTDRDGLAILDWLPAAGHVHALPRDYHTLRVASREAEARLRHRVAGVDQVRALGDQAAITVR